MAVGDLYRVSFNYNVYGQSNVNVMYMKQTRTMGQDTANDFAEEVAPFLRDLYNPVVAGTRFLGTVTTVQLVARLASDVGEFSANFPTDGASLGGALPPANAVIIRLRTGFAGRTRRGRIFLGGVSTNWTNQGVLSGPGATVYEQFCTNLRTNFLGDNPLSGAQLGVFSRSRFAIIGNPFDDYWKPVTQLQVPTAIATMRSRKVGVGA